MHKSDDSDAKKPDKQDEEIRLLFSLSASEIENYKQRQWKVTNYVALIYVSAFVALEQIGGKNAKAYRVVPGCPGSA